MSSQHTYHSDNLPPPHLLDHLDAVFWEADPVTSNFTYISGKEDKLLGYSREQWLEDGFWLAKLHPDDRDWAPHYCLEATKSLRSHRFDYRMLAADGRIVWIHDRVSVVARGGVIEKLCGMLLDITESKENEIALSETRMQLEHAQQLARVGSFTHDLQTGSFKSSSQCLAIFGQEADTSDSFERFMSQIVDLDREEFKAQFQLALDSSVDEFRNEFRFRLPNQELRHISAICSIVRDARGKATQVTGAVRDITERKLAEAERAEAHRFLASMNQIHSAALRSNEFEQMVADVLMEMLDIFDCDCIWLAQCEDLSFTNDDEWQLVVEQRRAEFPESIRGNQFPSHLGTMFSSAMDSKAPFAIDIYSKKSATEDFAEKFQFKTQACIAVQARGGKHNVLALQHRRREHEWTNSEKVLLESVCRRLADAIASLLAFRSLKESEKRQLAAQRLTRLGYWDRDYGRNRYTVSEEAMRILGIDEPSEAGDVEICYQTFLDRVHPDDRQRVKQASANALAGSEPYDIEYRLVLENGEERYVHSRGEVMWDDSGKPTRWFGTIQEISELRRVELELRASESRFRTYLDHASDMVMLQDAQGIIIDVNQTACNKLGYDREELIGRDYSLFDVGQISESVTALHEALGRGQVFELESCHRRKDGSEFPVEVQVAPVRSNGSVNAVSLTRDITERKRAERALNDSHNLLRAIVEGTSDAIYVKDLAGRYLAINSAGAKLFGLRVEDVLCRLDSELPLTEAARVLMRTCQSDPPSKAPQMYEEELVVDGKPCTYVSTRYNYYDSSGNPIGNIGISRDVSELKQLSDELRHSQKMEAVGRLAGGIAHDFNNLLTVIISYSELLLLQLAEGDSKRHQVNEIFKCGERAANLTRQLLAFSRKQKLRPELVDLRESLDELKSLLLPIIGEDIELSIDVAEEVQEVKMDRDQFRQSIANLAVNARDAMPNGGSLSIQVDDYLWQPDSSSQSTLGPNLRPGRYARLSVSDTGVGMTESVQARIFEPFFTTKPLGKGTGLGLSMTYGFVTQSGGHIEVTSAGGQGSTFRLYLPCDALDDNDLLSPVEHSEMVHSSPKGNETILLVEDEETVRGLCCRILEASGYSVVQAKDGIEALEQLNATKHPIDLLLTDVVMPRMNGPKLLESIQVKLPDLPVLFISGYADDIILRDIPADKRNFLRKPFSPKQLAERVRATLKVASS